MNQEFEEILNRLKDIENNVKQNHDMLESIQRRARLSILFSLIKLFIILGFTFGAFYFIKPYLDQTLGMYQQVVGLTGGVNATSTQNMFDTLRILLR